MSPEPMVYAPPWIHTITGRAPLSAHGVNTLRNRQSSSVCRSAWTPTVPTTGGGWGPTAPKAVAS